MVLAVAVPPFFLAYSECSEHEQQEALQKSFIAGVDACSSLDGSLQGHIIPDVTEPER
jgi:hypothetical protein